MPKCIIRADVSDTIDVTVDIPEDRIKTMTDGEWRQLFFDNLKNNPFPDSYIDPWQVTNESGEEITAWC